MPKVGMEPVRKKQLIEATLEVMAEVGYHGTTISLISKRAGLSSGIISHYFGDKQGLIEATMRLLLDALKITQRIDDPLERIDFIIENNFSQTPGASSATNTGLLGVVTSQWGLASFASINHKRLERSLVSYRFFNLSRSKRRGVYPALIDGYWSLFYGQCG